MRVPLLDLKEQLKPLRDDIVTKVTELIDSTQYIMGDAVSEFEGHIASYCQTRHAVGVASGTDALLASLMALGVGPGDYVLTTPYSFIATLGCILRLGARPLFADIEPVSCNIDPRKIAEIFAGDQKVVRRIKAIIPVHLYGQCADMTAIMAIAKEHGVAVVEDAAQAIGSACPVEVDGAAVWHKAGSIGDVGCFSFFPSKNLGGIGDGGMIVLNDDDLAEKIRIVRVHGGAPRYHHAVVGGNFRLDAIQAVALDVKLPHLPAWHQGRRRNAETYNSLFTESGLLAGGKVSLPTAVYKDLAEKESDLPDYHIYNQYVIRVENRTALKDYLLSHDIVTEIYYPIALHRQECMSAAENALQLPEAEKAAQETLALPIYPELTPEMLEYVVTKISDFYRG